MDTYIYIYTHFFLLKQISCLTLEFVSLKLADACDFGHVTWIFLFMDLEDSTRNAEAFRWSGGMLDTFSNWMDRVWVQNRPAISQDRSVNKNCPELHLASPAANKVLALLMEVPGSLMPQTRKAFCVSKTW